MCDHVRPHDSQDLMSAIRVARDVEKLCTHSRVGGGSAIKVQSTWGGATKVVSRGEPSREIQGRGGIAESTGSNRRETTQGSGVVRTNVEERGRNVRNLPYSVFFMRRE